MLDASGVQSLRAPRFARSLQDHACFDFGSRAHGLRRIRYELQRRNRGVGLELCWLEQRRRGGANAELRWLSRGAAKRCRSQRRRSERLRRLVKRCRWIACWRDSHRRQRQRRGRNSERRRNRSRRKRRERRRHRSNKRSRRRRRSRRADQRRRGGRKPRTRVRVLGRTVLRRLPLQTEDVFLRSGNPSQ